MARNETVGPFEESPQSRWLLGWSFVDGIVRVILEPSFLLVSHWHREFLHDDRSQINICYFLWDKSLYKNDALILAHTFFLSSVANAQIGMGLWCLSCTLHLRAWLEVGGVSQDFCSVLSGWPAGAPGLVQSVHTLSTICMLLAPRFLSSSQTSLLSGLLDVIT